MGNPKFGTAQYNKKVKANKDRKRRAARARILNMPFVKKAVRIASEESAVGLHTRMGEIARRSNQHMREKVQLRHASQAAEATYKRQAKELQTS